MKNPISEIFRMNQEDLLANPTLSYDQRKVVKAISTCKTEQLGLNKTFCSSCGHEEIHYNSCRNRHCPTCQAVPQAVWIEKRKLDLLPVRYFHAVFTVPDTLRPLFWSNQRELYNLLYSAVAMTLKKLAEDSSHLGGKIGFISLLHTFGQNLSYHPHLHVIVMGGGLTESNAFVQTKGDFLFPVKVVSRLFRGIFLDKLSHLYKAYKLKLEAGLSQYKSKRTWNSFLEGLYTAEWVPYLKHAFNSPEAVIEYLGRYTHRIAISNSRVVSYDSQSVSFHYKDYKSGEKKIMTLPATEFIRRFLMHVLPRGFVKIRHYGILSNRAKEKSLSRLRIILHRKIAKMNWRPLKDFSAKTVLKEIFGHDVSLCRNCGKPLNFTPQLE